MKNAHTDNASTDSVRSSIPGNKEPGQQHWHQDEGPVRGRVSEVSWSKLHKQTVAESLEENVASDRVYKGNPSDCSDHTVSDPSGAHHQGHCASGVRHD